MKELQAIYINHCDISAAQLPICYKHDPQGVHIVRSCGFDLRTRPVLRMTIEISYLGMVWFEICACIDCASVLEAEEPRSGDGDVDSIINTVAVVSRQTKEADIMAANGFMDPTDPVEILDSRNECVIDVHAPTKRDAFM